MRLFTFAFCIAAVFLLFPQVSAEIQNHSDASLAYAQTASDPLGESDSSQLDKIAKAHQKQVDKANQSPFEGMSLMAITLIVAGCAWFWFRKNMSE